MDSFEILALELNFCPSKSYSIVPNKQMSYNATFTISCFLIFPLYQYKIFGIVFNMQEFMLVFLCFVGFTDEFQEMCKNIGKNMREVESEKEYLT